MSDADAAVEALLRIVDRDNARLALALEQLDKGAAEIERLRADLRHLRKATIADRQDITRKDAEIERLRNEVETWVAQAQRVAIENARLRAFVESVRNWDRFPLTELTDTDHERATAYRRQLEIHAAMARKALEGGAGLCRCGPRCKIRVF